MHSPPKVTEDFMKTPPNQKEVSPAASQRSKKSVRVEANTPPRLEVPKVQNPYANSPRDLANNTLNERDSHYDSRSSFHKTLTVAEKEAIALKKKKERM